MINMSIDLEISIEVEELSYKVSIQRVCNFIVRAKVLHVESVILKNTEHDHLFLPWFA